MIGRDDQLVDQLHAANNLIKTRFNPNYLILIFTHLNLCLADAINNIQS